MSCLYTNICVNNATQVFKIMRNSTDNYTITVYYKNPNTGKYIIQNDLTENYLFSELKITNIINFIKLNKRKPRTNELTNM